MHACFTGEVPQCFTDCSPDVTSSGTQLSNGDAALQCYVICGGLPKATRRALGAALQVPFKVIEQQ